MLPVFWFDEHIYLFIIYFNFLGTYQKPYVALIDGITMGGVSIYLKLSSCCTSTPADGAVCSDLAQYGIEGTKSRGNVGQLVFVFTKIKK